MRALVRQTRSKKNDLNWKIVFRWQGPGRRRDLVRMVHADTRKEAKQRAFLMSRQSGYHPVRFELQGEAMKTWKVRFEWRGPGRQRPKVRTIQAENDAQAETAANRMAFASYWWPVSVELKRGRA